jgi:hypothetical protein
MPGRPSCAAREDALDTDDHMYHETMRRANGLLADHFDAVRRVRGREEAAQSVRQVIDKGVDIIMRAPAKRRAQSSKLIIGQVTVGKRDDIVAEICADVEDLAKERREDSIVAIRSGDSTLSFLPDVYVPNDDGLEASWRVFVSTLQRRCLACPDPHTGLRHRIPFRDGRWLCDIAFSRGVDLTVHKDIAGLDGSLHLNGVSFKTTHKLDVKGHVYADMSQVRAIKSPVASLGRDLHLFDSGYKSVADLDLSPAMLEAWGLTDGKRLVINERVMFVFSAHEHDRQRFFGLIECPGGKVCLDFRSMRLLWDGRAWSHFQRELPPETVYAVRKKFARICTVLNIGDDFTSERDDPVKMIDQDFRRLAAFLELVRGAHSIRAVEKLAPEEAAAVRELEEPAAKIRALAVGEGMGFDEDMGATSAAILAQCEAITDDMLARVRDVQIKHGRTIPLEKANRDAKYLEETLAGPTSFNLLLGTSGRALVFLNNLFRSPEAKALATRKISTLRKELAQVMGGKASNVVLINLLKKIKDHSAPALKKLYGKETDISALARLLDDLNAKTPRETVTEFILGLPPADTSPELAQDRSLLLRCEELGQGTLAEAFALDDPDKEHALDGTIMNACLAVSLETFLAEHARGETRLLADLAPPSAVEELLGLITRYQPVLKTWNKLVAHRG